MKAVILAGGLGTRLKSILNDLYHGIDVTEERLKQILCLFQLDASQGFVEEMNGKPVYVGLAMDENSKIKFKPQNILTNLPLSNSS